MSFPQARLQQYGFKDMHQFRNWRWYKGKGGGPIVDLGSHQIDIYSWFLGANPSHVMASGGNLYYDPKTHEWYDTVMAVYDFDTPLGPAKAYYQTQTTNGSQGYFENFMGDQGTLLISESEVNYAGQLYRDPNAPAWDEWVQKGYVSAPKEQETKAKGDSGRDCRRARVGRTRPAHRSGHAARPVPPAAPAELLRRRSRQGEAQLPGGGRLRDRGGRPEGERSDRGEVAAVVHARGIQGLGGARTMEDGLSRSPMIAITVLRVVVGWHFLYEGIAKLASPTWSAAGYMKVSRGPFADLFRWIASQPHLLDNANLITMYGLTVVGVLLMLGLFTRLAALGGHRLRPVVLPVQPAVRRLLLLDPHGGQLPDREQEPGGTVCAHRHHGDGSGRFAGLDRILHGLFARRRGLVPA